MTKIADILKYYEHILQKVKSVFVCLEYDMDIMEKLSAQWLHSCAMLKWLKWLVHKMIVSRLSHDYHNTNSAKTKHTHTS